ncbi:MAG: FAD/NAD(P)-binding protein [Candidatus Omnitrophica bacterium]|nr:FAD/NAD(P)-binding protein [Candidatus Omnitrophota bacterium]
MVPNLHRIQKVTQETSDTFTLALAPSCGRKCPAFRPGQFNMLYVFGVGEVPISISGDPATPETLVHTTRAVGAVTAAMKKMRPGDQLGVRGPYGTEWPVAEAHDRDVVIVAGGIGLAPLRPALYSLLNHRERYGRVVLLYGTRSPEDILYRTEIQKWRSQFDLDVHVTVDRATGKWRGNVGVVTSLIPKAPFDPYHATAFVCGPEIMMRYTILALLKRGVEKDSIHLSMERNMKCAVGFCGHCQIGPLFVCRDGPVFGYPRLEKLLDKREL